MPHTNVYKASSHLIMDIPSCNEKKLHLASMEIWTENTRNITQFFSEIVAKEKRVAGYKFNQRCFICDEGGYNYNAITEVYGEDFCNALVRGCQWHLKNDGDRYTHGIQRYVQGHLPSIMCSLNDFKVQRAESQIR